MGVITLLWGLVRNVAGFYSNQHKTKISFRNLHKNNYDVLQIFRRDETVSIWKTPSPYFHVNMYILFQRVLLYTSLLLSNQKRKKKEDDLVVSNKYKIHSNFWLK